MMTYPQPPAAESTASLEQRLSALNRLLDVTRRLAGEIDLTQVLRTIASEACQALECERASLFRYDPATEELCTVIATELEIAEVRHGLDHGISGYAARYRQLVNVPDPASDPRWNSRIDRQTGYQTRSILAAPLVSPHDGVLLGVLELLNNIGGPFDAFDEELVAAFAAHAAVALDRARLVEALRKREALDASLEVARQIQRGFIPQQIAPVPGYELATWWFPNAAVGGDYCDVIPLLDGRRGLVVADVSGHGLGPALLMASTRAALRALVLAHAAPADLLNLVARALAPDLSDGNFITMIVAVLDPAAHVLEYANAGHAPALHYASAADRFDVLSSTGMPLGVEETPSFESGPRVDLLPGDIVLLCTDGIVEAMDESDVPFGQTRLEALVREHCRLPVETLVHRIGAEVEAHYVGETPSDDLTILVARRIANNNG